MSKGKKYLLYTALAIVVVLALASLYAFRPEYKITDSDSGNKMLTVKKGIGRFSMEYPPHFEITHVEMNREVLYTNVDLLALIPADERTVSLLEVFITETDASPDAETAMLKAFSRARDNQYRFKLLDKSHVTVAGVHGYQFTYSYEFTFPMGIDREPIPYMSREVYFDHSGLIWNIDMNSPDFNITSDNQALELVLSTFKILN